MDTLQIFANFEPFYLPYNCSVKYSCQRTNAMRSISSSINNSMFAPRKASAAYKISIAHNQVYCKRSASNMNQAEHERSASALMDPCFQKESKPTATASKGLGIVDILKDNNFLVTGATGFVAKVLIEKILRVQPDVGKLFLVMKAKDSSSALERVKNEIMNMELFKEIQKSYGNGYNDFILEKLVPVVGDMTKDNLGIEPDVADMLFKEVDIIVSSAANTTFDERYDFSLEMNTRGVSRLMEFGKRCKKVQLFVHMSTAYANGQIHGPALEKLLHMGDCEVKEEGQTSVSLMDIEAEFDLAKDTISDIEAEVADFQKPNSLNVIDPNKKLAQRMRDLGIARARKYGWQDTYSLTKAMGEMLLVNDRGDLPVVILRPSIIESTFSSPFPGWIEGHRMLDPIISYYGKGQMGGVFADPNTIIDLVPVDMVVNATLATVAKHAGNPGIHVYHVASSVTNPIKLQHVVEAIFEHFRSNPYIDNKGKPVELQKELAFFPTMEDFSNHAWNNAFNAPFNKAGLQLFGPNMSEREKNICIKCIEQAQNISMLYEPYAFYKGRFDISNLEMLYLELSEEEQDTFGFDVKKIEWKNYIANIHIPGLRQHVMKGRGIGLKGLNQNKAVIPDDIK